MVDLKRIRARFFEQVSGNLPMREWLLGLSDGDRKAVGDDIRTAEFGWPVRMPLCRAMKSQTGMWKIRTNLPGGRIARVMFCIHQGEMILLHGFMKKARKTPQRELDIAVRRMKGLEG